MASKILNIIYREVCWSIGKALNGTITHQQRGFTKGRVPTVNVIDIDTVTRSHSATFDGDLPSQPLLALWDVENAFCSMAHEWMDLVIKSWRLTQGAHNAMLQTYRDVGL